MLICGPHLILKIDIYINLNTEFEIILFIHVKKTTLGARRAGFISPSVSISSGGISVHNKVFCFICYPY